MKNINNYLPGTGNVLPKHLQYVWQRAIMVLAAILTMGLGAYAQVAQVDPPAGGFDIDGNLRANFTTINIGDWVTGSGGTGGFVFNVTANGIATAVTGLNADLKRDPYNDRSDIIFTEGSKFNANPNTWAWSVSKAPNKNDINNAMYLVTRSANNHDWIIIGGDRLSTSGTSYIDFELLQKTLKRNSGGNGFTSEGEDGGRTVGDLVVSMEYSNGGSKPVVRIYRWQEIGGTGSGVFDYVMANRDLSAFVFAETNRAGAVDVPFKGFGSTSYSQYAFVEAAIDVTGILSEIADPCTGLSIKTIFIKTKASDSQTAALKDMVEPVPVSIDFGSASITYNGPFCPTGTASVTRTGITGGTYSASPTGLSINSSTGEINLAASTPGSYTVTYTYTTNNCVRTATAPVVINARPAEQTLTGGAYCEGATPAGAALTLTDTESGVSYQLQVRGGTAPSYTWSDVNGAVVTGDGNGGSFGLRLTGVYRVVATGAAPTSCTNTFGNAEVTVENRPAEQTLNGGAYCSGSNPAGAEVKLADTEDGVNYQLQIRSGTAPNYTWSNVENSLKSGTGDEVSFGVKPLGTYRVVATGAAPNSCTRTFGNVTITETNPPLMQVLNGGSYCSGANPAGAAVTLTDTESGVSYQLQVRGGTAPSYTWSDVNGAVVTGDGNGGSFGLRLTGVYRVVATGAAPTSCTNTFGNAEVNLSPNPSPPSVTYNHPACDSDKFSLTVTGISVGDKVTLVDKNGASITGALPASPYTVTSTDLVVVNGNSVVGFNYTNIPAGSGYKVSVTTAAGCTSGTNSCPVANELSEVVKSQSQSLTTDEVTAYPVPFYDKTTIEFKSERNGKYVINLYDMKGKLVRELKSGTIKAGEIKSIEVDGKDLAEGMYLARIVSDTGSKTVKLLKRR